MKRNGFTLAEVLITLAIIGVVAAMTIPTLMTNTTETQYKTGFKKAYSQLAKAAQMNVYQNGYGFGDVIAETATNKGKSKTLSHFLMSNFDNPTDVTTTYFTETGALKPNVDTTKTCPYAYSDCTDTDFQGKATKKACQTAATFGGNQCSNAGEELKYQKQVTFDASKAVAYSLADGSIIAYVKADKQCDNSPDHFCYILLDVNGAKGPNTVSSDANGIKDIFLVNIRDNSIAPGNDYIRTLLQD